VAALAAVAVRLIILVAIQPVRQVLAVVVSWDRVPLVVRVVQLQVVVTVVPVVQMEVLRQTKPMAQQAAAAGVLLVVKAMHPMGLLVPLALVVQLFQEHL
jgi:hypothetical protein